MNGEVGVSGEPGYRGRFWFTALLQNVECGALPVRPFAGRTALILDPSKGTREQAQLLLAKFRFHVQVAGSLPELPHAPSPDVVLLNYRVVYLVGWSVVSHLRSLLQQPKLPVIYVAAQWQRQQAAAIPVRSMRALFAEDNIVNQKVRPASSNASAPSATSPIMASRRSTPLLANVSTTS